MSHDELTVNHNRTHDAEHTCCCKIKTRYLRISYFVLYLLSEDLMGKYGLHFVQRAGLNGNLCKYIIKE